MMTDEVFEEARQRREPTPDGRGLSFIDLAHDAFPGNHGAVIHFTQLIVGRDMESPHKVLHVELVSTAGASAFLLGEPNFLFGDVGEPCEGRQSAGESVTICNSVLLSVIGEASLLAFRPL